MTEPIVIVGAGASAVHFAQTALELGQTVLMLDVGFEKPAAIRPEASLNDLKDQLDDPVAYFLGKEYEALILPSSHEEYYGFPPTKSYVFRQVNELDVDSHGFAPLLSFAAGGLAQAWTGGCYPFTAEEVSAFPFDYADLLRAYGEVARRVGISGVGDDLRPFLPVHDGLLPPVPLDAHAARLLADYGRRKPRVNEKDGIYMGHARIATLSQALANRAPCTRLGRCLWGCPTESLYTPSVTLDWCRRHPRFHYMPGLRVDHFDVNDANRVTQVVARFVSNGAEWSTRPGTLVLAAGTLSSTGILLQSLGRQGVRAELSGLMDNRQVLMPFVNMHQLGKRFDDRTYQYHQLAIAMPGTRPDDYVHGLVTTLKTALIHPVVQSLPLGMRAATSLFRNLHAGLGLVNINFSDRRRENNRVALDVDKSGRTRLSVFYSPDPAENDAIRPAIRRFRRFLATVGAVAPPNMTRMRPMGASVHYAGTLPMVENGGDFTTDSLGRCRPFSNLVVADGSTFPSLPAKNLTFTLMANATRIARTLMGL